jgi:hypothetical protein
LYYRKSLNYNIHLGYWEWDPSAYAVVIWPIFFKCHPFWYLG